jgi:hypothetical protein
MATMASAYGWAPASRKSSRELLMLATATVVEVGEVARVAADLAKQATVPFVLVKKAVSTFRMTWEIRGDFVRLWHRQAQLIDKLDADAASEESWLHETCSEMSGLLDELAQSERSMLSVANTAPQIVRKFWGPPFEALEPQLCKIEMHCRRLDALSVPEVAKDGDEEYRRFAASLDSSAEYNLS